MVLSKRNFRSFLIKQRFVDEDHRKRNYPFMYEKRGETVQKIIGKWLHNQTEKETGEGPDLKTVVR